MSDEGERSTVKRGLTILIVILLLFAVGMVVLGEYLVAGVTFLSITFAIYLREISQ